MFRECTACKKVWETVDSFIEDDLVIFKGYQPSPSSPLNGLFYFLHDINCCGTTMAMKISYVTSLLTKTEEIQSFELGKVDDCPGFCLDPKNINSCSSKTCNGRIIRDVIERITRIKG